jgi:hypothetical protein
VIAGWLTTNSTLVTALGGMASTVFVAIYMTRSHSRSSEAERRHSVQQHMLAERKSAYQRMLQAFEEFDDTLYLLWASHYTGRDGARTRLTKEIRALLDRNSKVDLAIQDLERELELIAPLDVVKACRITFRALREKTQILVDGGNVKPQPYNACLAETVRLMRSNLYKLMQPNRDDINTPMDGPEQDFMSLFDEWLAPENVFSRQG